MFLDTLMNYYSVHARSDLPWRRPEPNGTFDCYKILVSELMLQQTQVARVIPKYDAFLKQFPTIQSLAAAELGDVLRAWQGLGYNRRAKYLWSAAKQVATDGWPDNLTRLPGVGVNTAGAVKAYAFNQPAIFVETNIRTVYIHHFASDQQNVPDSLILDLLARTLSLLSVGKEQPEQKSHFLPGALRKTEGLSQYRVFYWALMDYGTFLKTQVRNLQQSKHYKQQSAFRGSKRQIRGLIIRELSKEPLTLSALQTYAEDDRLGAVLTELQKEGLIIKRGKLYHLSP